MSSLLDGLQILLLCNKNLKAPTKSGFFVLWPGRMKRPASMRMGRKTKNERQRTLRFLLTRPPQRDHVS